MSFLSVSLSLVMLANQHGKHGSQKHEDQGLNESHEQLHEIKRDGQQPAKARNQLGHRFEHVFTGENIAVKTEAQRDRPEKNREDFEEPDGDKDDDHEDLQRAGGFAFRSEQVQQKAN